MSITRRRFVASATVAAGTLARSGVRAAPQPVRVGYIADFTGASLYAVAADQGYWQQQDLVPDLKVFTNGPLQIQALGAGSLDFGYIGPGALWLPASGKARIVAINGIGLSDFVVAQAGNRTMTDLKGKKVGVPEGTSGDMVLRLALERSGMSMDDIQAIKMDPSTIVAAFASKQIDAAGIWYPLIATMKKAVPDLSEIIGAKDFYPDRTFPNAIVARNEVGTAQPDLAAKFVRVLKQATDYRAKNLDKSIELTADMLGIPIEDVRGDAAYGQFPDSAELIGFTKDGTVDRWLSGMNQLFASFGKLSNALPPKDY